MKTNIFKIAAMMLVLAGGFSSCKENNIPETIDSNTFLEQLKQAPYVKASKENLPDWLVDRTGGILHNISNY